MVRCSQCFGSFSDITKPKQNRNCISSIEHVTGLQCTALLVTNMLRDHMYIGCIGRTNPINIEQMSSFGRRRYWIADILHLLYRRNECKLIIKSLYSRIDRQCKREHYYSNATSPHTHTCQILYWRRDSERLTTKYIQQQQKKKKRDRQQTERIVHDKK